MSWRDSARPIISKVLHETQGMAPREIDAAIFDAYPFGQRRYHPYKIWLDEVKRQRYGEVKRQRYGAKPRAQDPNQMSIEDAYGTVEIK